MTLAAFWERVNDMCVLIATQPVHAVKQPTYALM